MDNRIDLEQRGGAPLDERQPSGRPTGLPVTSDLAPAHATSLLIAALVALASAVGLGWGSGDLYGGTSSVLVSRGGDAANLVVVLPVLLGSTWLARRGSLTGLLLWPGALFYALYAYVPYLVGARFTPLVFAYVALVTFSTFTLIGIVVSVDGAKVREYLAGAPAHGVGGALVAIAILAYAGLAAEAVGALGSPISEPTWRGHWVADWTVGTPVLLLGGWLLWHRAPLGYVAAAGLLLVSGLGGVAFSLAAVVDDLLTGPWTEPAVIFVHLVIAAGSFALLAFFLRSAKSSFGARSPKPA